MLKDVNGKEIGYYSIRADGKGRAYGHFMGLDMKAIEISDADKLHNGICPDCNFNKLKNTIDNSGRRITSCEVCGFYTE